MKKLLGIIFGFILTTNMAFGMGKAGAEVASTPDYSNPATPWEPAKPKAPIEGEIVVKPTNNSLEVDFLNNDKQLITKKEFTGEHIGSGYNQIESGVYFNENANYGIVIAYVNTKGNSQEEFYRTGEFRQHDDIIEFYDVKGTLLFRKAKMDYLPIAITPDGQYVICYYQSVDLSEWNVSEKLQQKKDRLIVLNRSGDVVFEDEADRVNYQSVHVSPNSVWMSCEVQAEVRLTLLINLQQRNLVKKITNHIIHKSGIAFVDDDGMMYFTKIVGKTQDQRNIKLRCVYNPFDDSTKQIRQEIQKNSWEK